MSGVRTPAGKAEWRAPCPLLMKKAGKGKEKETRSPGSPLRGGGGSSLFHLGNTKLKLISREAEQPRRGCGSQAEAFKS